MKICTLLFFFLVFTIISFSFFLLHHGFYQVGLYNSWKIPQPSEITVLSVASSQADSPEGSVIYILSQTGLQTWPLKQL